MMNTSHPTPESMPAAPTAAERIAHARALVHDAARGDAAPSAWRDALTELSLAADDGTDADKLTYVRAVHALAGDARSAEATLDHASRAASIVNNLLRFAPSVDAMVLTGWMLARGQGYAVNPARARAMMTAAAAAGSAEAHLELAIFDATAFGGETDLDSAAAHLRTAAKMGHARAMTMLADAHATAAMGIELDRRRALAWYKRAAEAGSTRAAHRLALMYARGDGVPADAELSAQFATRARELATAAPQF